MSTLSGQSIDTTYQGLLKTTDNAALSGTLKTIEDGAGNASPLQLSTSDVQIASNNIVIADSTVTHGLAITGTEAQAAGPWDYTGTHDFSAATVVGIGGGGTPEFNPFWVSSGALTTTGEINFFTSFAMPVWLRQGQVLEEFTTSIHTAYAAGATFSVYLYNTQRRTTPSATGYVYPYTKLHTIGTGLAADVTGQITVNMTDYTVPSTGLYYVYYTVTTDGGYWHKCNLSFSAGNAYQYSTNLHNQYNQNAATASRHWFSGTSAGAPATLPADGTGINDMSPDPWFIFKINS